MVKNMLSNLHIILYIVVSQVLSCPKEIFLAQRSTKTQLLLTEDSVLPLHTVGRSVWHQEQTRLSGDTPRKPTINDCGWSTFHIENIQGKTQASPSFPYIKGKQ
jgi:hypothetical protein